MKQFWRLILLLCLMTAALAACGSQAENTSSEPVSVTSDTTANNAQNDIFSTMIQDDVFSTMMQEHFPEISVSVGMRAKDYPADTGEFFELYPGVNCQLLSVDSPNNSGTYATLYFLENSGLSLIEIYNVGFDQEYITDMYGDPIFSSGTDFDADYYWMLEDVLMIYSSADSNLKLYTEACAELLCPEQLLLAKTGLLLYLTEFDDLYWYQDLLSWKYGLYDLSEDTMLTEACYDSYGLFDESGMAPVKKDNYWGYINASGETIIGHYFEDAKAFSGDCAVVKNNGKWGAIDSYGNYVVQPEYNDVEINGNFIIVKNDLKYYGAFNTEGNELITASRGIHNERYENIIVLNNRLYAKTSDRWFHVFDENGNPLLGNDPLNEIIAVSFPQNGFHIARASGNNYTFADENLNLRGYKYYKELTDFSKSGYAIGCIDWISWEVIDTEGTVLYTLSELNNGDGNTFYEYANKYLAYGYYALGMGQNSVHYGVVDMQTGTFTEYANVKPIDGTECIIVSADSGLMGLYEKDSLVLSCVYDNITFDGSRFELTRGAEKSTYDPE